MTQANRAYNTPRTNMTKTENDDQDRYLATAYRRMECDVSNLERMGTIADRLVAEWTEDASNERAAELANFAVQQLADMLETFRKGYQANFAGARSGVE